MDKDYQCESFETNASDRKFDTVTCNLKLLVTFKHHRGWTSARLKDNTVLLGIPHSGSCECLEKTHRCHFMCHTSILPCLLTTNLQAENKQSQTFSLGTRNVTGSMLLEVRRIARASSTWRTLTEDFGRNDKAWWTQSALKSDKALSCGVSVLTSNAYTVLSPCKHHFNLCSSFPPEFHGLMLRSFGVVNSCSPYTREQKLSRNIPVNSRARDHKSSTGEKLSSCSSYSWIPVIYFR